MSDLDLNDIYVDDNPWEELLKSNNKGQEKLLSSTNSLTNLSKSKISLKSSIKLNKNQNDNDNRVVTINEIVNLDCNQIKVIKILEYQYVITKHLKNNLKNLSEDKESNKELINKINWLLYSVNHMSNKLDLGQAPQKKHDDDATISRSSYKFCKYNYKCKYLYKDNNITNSCFEQHIVYNYLYHDIKNLFDYINNNDKYDIVEIQKCINTIYFVINHIKEELENLKDTSGCNLDTIKCIKKNNNKNLSSA